MLQCFFISDTQEFGRTDVFRCEILHAFQVASPDVDIRFFFASVRALLQKKTWTLEDSRHLAEYFHFYDVNEFLPGAFRFFAWIKEKYEKHIENTAYTVLADECSINEMARWCVQWQISWRIYEVLASFSDPKIIPLSREKQFFVLRNRWYSSVSEKWLQPSDLNLPESFDGYLHELYPIAKQFGFSEWEDAVPPYERFAEWFYKNILIEALPFDQE